jgi:transposase
MGRAAATRDLTAALDSPGRGSSDVDTVDQRPGNPAPVPLDLFLTALAAAGRMAQVAAGARIHCGDELEARGELRAPRGTRHRDAAALERLTQDFQHATVELGELVEEQHAMQRKRDLPRPGQAAAADQRCRGCGVVRRPERPAPPAPQIEAAIDKRLHRGGLERLGLGHRWQDARQAGRQHRLAGTRRADQQQAVPASGREFERPAGLRLPGHVGEVGDGVV